jgi:hypothetical protein
VHVSVSVPVVEQYSHESSFTVGLLALVIVPSGTSPLTVPISLPGARLGRKRLMITGPAVAPTFVAEPR